MLASIAEREQFRSIYAAKIANNSNPHKLISRKNTNPHYFLSLKLPIPHKFHLLDDKILLKKWSIS